MKKILLLVFALSLGTAAVAQLHPVFTKAKNQNVEALRPAFRHDGNFIGIQNPNVTVASKLTLMDPSTMQTKYDLQTNAGTQNRIYMYPDGTIGVTATMSHTTNFNDRGTGYNYFNGTAWGTAPAIRTESIRTGWPSLAPCGTGEITISHQSGTANLVIEKRATKGTGTWTETYLDGPSGASGMLWPRLVTSGPDHNTVHLICMTSPVANGGTVYNDLDGALLYNRSVNGGTTWEGWVQLDGLNSTNYTDFSGDGYAFAEPRGDTIAFVYGDNWLDFGLLKSTDNGATWTRSLIWENPYVLWPGTSVTDTFYTTDGCPAAAIDKHGNVHVTIGLSAARGDEAGDKWYFPFTDGLLYWNETMPLWDEVLDPVTLEENGNVIGWVQDTEVFDAEPTELAHFGNGLSSFPTMVIDEADHVFVIWSSVTKIRDINNYMYRHIYARASIDLGVTWRDTIVPLNTDFEYGFMEAVYPSASPTSDDNLKIIFQTDADAGVYLNSQTTPPQQGQSEITTNDITFLDFPKSDIIIVGMAEKKKESIQTRVYPNPVMDMATFKIILKQSGNLVIEITNMVGQKVMSFNKGYVNSGSQQFTIDASGIQAGVYFYTIKLGDQKYTNKMVVK